MASQRHNSGGAVSARAASADRDIPLEVLDATRAAVLAVGVRRTTLTDVARRAGVSRMTLYRLVPDVTTLVLEGMTRDFAALLQAAEAKAGPGGAGGGPRRPRAGEGGPAVARGGPVWWGRRG